MADKELSRTSGKFAKKEEFITSNYRKEVELN